MITYLYWIVIVALSSGMLFVFGHKMKEWKIASAAAMSILIIGYLTYTSYFQQIFVEQYGGVMTVKVPEGEIHLATTWKDDNLWIENYNPETNTCHFREYSGGNLLQGEVRIKNCNPLLRKSSVTTPVTP